MISCGEGSFCAFGEMDRGDRVVEGQKVVLWGELFLVQVDVFVLM